MLTFFSILESSANCLSGDDFPSFFDLLSDFANDDSPDNVKHHKDAIIVPSIVVTTNSSSTQKSPKGKRKFKHLNKPKFLVTKPK